MHLFERGLTLTKCPGLSSWTYRFENESCKIVLHATSSPSAICISLYDLWKCMGRGVIEGGDLSRKSGYEYILGTCVLNDYWSIYPITFEMIGWEMLQVKHLGSIIWSLRMTRVENVDWKVARKSWQYHGWRSSRNIAHLTISVPMCS